MKRILLIGIGGVYNYGCEAIVRGTVNILRSKWPNCEIVYATPRVEDDRRRLAGCDVTIVHRRFNRYSGKNILRKLLSYFGCRWQPCLEDLSLLKNIDAVYSIGGDIFTLSPTGSYNASLAKFGTIAERKKIPCVLWGASVGPFTANPKAETFFKRHLSQISQIVAREQGTVDYLASIGISSNVTLRPDPAFFVAPEIHTNNDKPKTRPVIGINLSPLSVSYTGLSQKEAIASQAHIIARLITECSADIMLIPHVVCSFNEGDDDLRYLQKIKKEISFPASKHVQIIENDPGFIGIKKYIIQCNFVVAARMHCAINAMATQTPTILVAYSQKSKGMTDFVYGNQKWLIEIDDFFSRHLFFLAKEMIKNRESIYQKLKNKIAEIFCEHGMHLNQ